jgi:HEAT repeat protein
MGVTLEPPLASSGDGLAMARWRISRRVLDGMDQLPLLYVMARQRAVRRARWALLQGERDRAREMAEDALACAPDLEPATRLLAAIQRLQAEGGGAGRPVTSLSLDGLAPKPPQRWETLRTELGHDPLHDLALRVAVLGRLLPLARAGVVPVKMARRATEALKRARASMAQGDLGWGLAAALTDFDKVTAAMLAAALDGTATGPGTEADSTLPDLTLVGGPHLKEGEVELELARRVLRANYGLVPRWVKGPKGGDGGKLSSGDGGKLSWVHLHEIRPILRSEGDGPVVQAKLQKRLGWGWLHAGLPPLRYSVTFADHGGEYWRRRAAGAGSMETLKPLARTLLRREIYSPDSEASFMAAAGITELDGDAAARDLLPLVKAAPPRLGAAVLRALALLRSSPVTEALAQATRSPSPEIRRAAMLALGQRALSTERSMLKKGLTDTSPEVTEAAVIGLLRAGDPAGLSLARRWLAEEREERAARILALAAQGQVKVKSLTGDLLRLTKRPRPLSGLPGALWGVMGERAVAELTRLYRAAPALRSQILELARGRVFKRFLQGLMTGGGPLPVALRRLVVLRLAQLAAPPRGLLERAAKDEDQQTRLAAFTGLARLGHADSLLALGQGARGSCHERAIVIPVLCQSLDRASRRRLLLDALASPCNHLHAEVWQLALRYQAGDLKLLQAALGHASREIRVRGALAALGLRGPAR